MNLVYFISLKLVIILKWITLVLSYYNFWILYIEIWVFVAFWSACVIIRIIFRDMTQAFELENEGENWTRVWFIWLAYDMAFELVSNKFSNVETEASSLLVQAMCIKKAKRSKKLLLYFLWYTYALIMNPNLNPFWIHIIVYLLLNYFVKNLVVLNTQIVNTFNYFRSYGNLFSWFAEFECVRN